MCEYIHGRFTRYTTTHATTHPRQSKHKDIAAPPLSLFLSLLNSPAVTEVRVINIIPTVARYAIAVKFLQRNAAADGVEEDEREGNPVGELIVKKLRENHFFGFTSLLPPLLEQRLLNE